jgi:hypothetical protein
MFYSLLPLLVHHLLLLLHLFVLFLLVFLEEVFVLRLCHLPPLLLPVLLLEAPHLVLLVTLGAVFNAKLSKLLLRNHRPHVGLKGKKG